MMAPRLGCHGLAYERKGGYGAYLARYLHTAYLTLHVLSVEYGVLAALGVMSERYLHRRELTAERLLVNGIGLNEAAAQGVEGDGAVHGACIYIGVSYLLGKSLGHCALTARRVAVHGYYYLFHMLNAKLQINDDSDTWYLP